MIYGIGTDIVEVKRIREALNKHGIALAKKILTSQELLTYKNTEVKENFLAKRFAAKEAFAKAMGTGMRSPVNFKSIEVIHDSLGKPKIKTIQKLSLLVKSYNIKYCHLSISDEKNIAVAFVILEK
ncbi:holo-ACP synthase [Methylophilaceae bacterium]|jgi:holo-[acyl-carrier protein] synthase|nr:holo-ACP synthase [Methylophilaceae bacterium]|tara:strand:- start:1786 stop:2163 length:378 start_codon:yes stop_codon:yes gene_type:complete